MKVKWSRTLRRYRIGKFGALCYITDNSDDRVFGFGTGFDWFHVPYQQHRAAYTEVDAIYVVEWLNERAAGYPTKIVVL